MTAINLLECLEEFVKEKTADIKLQVKVRNLNPQEVKERAADVYKMRLPKKEDQTEKSPVYPSSIPDREGRQGERGAAGKRLQNTDSGCNVFRGRRRRFFLMC